ncbi:MAG: SDR family oxidoreductase [Planctomycetes bacterium]|nr:SDR family oxidoreductase [Planctomycetota bacterium]
MMSNYNINSLFGIEGKVVVLTGGGGVLCGVMAEAMAANGAKVAILDLNPEAAKAKADEICKNGGQAIGIECDVLARESVEKARETVLKEWGVAQILINGAGGNHPIATTGGETVTDQLDPTFFDLDIKAIQFVFNLNFVGTLLPSQVFGKDMVEHKDGIIINLSSMNAIIPLTKIPAYSAAKAAVSNFTAWLAVHFAPAGVRVNAIAPGFFLTNQNRFLLTDEKTGEPTPRGGKIIRNTPLGRYGEPDELVSTLLWLTAPASKYISGIVVPVDGGFSAFSGV